MQSRYYDPEVGRFINADGYVSTGQGILGNNMFAYCINNPISFFDILGTCPYNGTVADFRRLEQGLPSLDCTCIDITDKLNLFMKTNSDKLKKHMENHNFYESAIYFYNIVKDDGELDIKLKDDWKFEGGTTYLFNNIELRYDDPGNINFGFVGAALFPEQVLCLGAGLNQIKKFGFKFGNILIFYDDPRDNIMIKYGYHLYMGGLQ